ncbi:MAG: 30S ribosomal protein S8e [Candidatus Bathyarchaeota archaeon]|nr:30S ribosomal protein S8e [Candidatus Bathyarchaeota archaeon]
MPWHSDLHKRKPTGGRRRPYRGKRKFEKGRSATETTIGETYRVVIRVRGGNIKNRLISTDVAQVSNPKTGKTKTVKILRVVKNPANPDYDRRGVITKGTIIETEEGKAAVTSRPSQNGVVNAVLIEK